MAQRAENNTWTDRESIRERARASARSFLSPVKAEREERPLSPELVARVTENTGREVGSKEDGPEGFDNHEERLTRQTERSRLNERPNTTYPG